ncbi:MAG: glycosyltransferase [Verrucomicrobiales bacterium]|nr:glycosyltransferase [Verrucomicrobiales bacterium]
MSPSVLLVGSSLSGGGAENRFRLLSENLFGGNVSLALFKADGRRLDQPETPVLDLCWKGFFSYPSMVLRLRRYLQRSDPDVVVSFGVYPNLVAWSAMRGLHKRPALVLNEITRPYQEELDTANPFRSYILSAMKRHVYSRAELFAANSSDGLNESVTHYRVDKGRARRVWNLLDMRTILALSAPSEAQNTEHIDPSICIAARQDKLKRIDTLLNAVSGLQQGLRWKVDIIGDGRENVSLRELSRSLGLCDRVTFHGWLKNPYPVIARASIFTLCSEYEGYSNAVLEAMGLGVPVITSLCSADASELGREGAALTFPVGDVHELRRQIGRLLQLPELRAQLRAKGREVAARHALEVVVPRYESLIREAISLTQPQGGVRV